MVARFFSSRSYPITGLVRKILTVNRREREKKGGTIDRFRKIKRNTYERRKRLYDVVCVSFTSKPLKVLLVLLYNTHQVPSIMPSYTLTPLEPQSRFGDKLFKFQVVCPQNGTAVLKGLIQ